MHKSKTIKTALFIQGNSCEGDLTVSHICVRTSFSQRVYANSLLSKTNSRGGHSVFTIRWQQMLQFRRTVSKALSSLQQIFICPSENRHLTKKRKKYIHIHTRFFICCSVDRKGNLLKPIYICMCLAAEVERWAGVLQPNFSLVRYFLFSFVSV